MQLHVAVHASLRLNLRLGLFAASIHRCVLCMKYHAHVDCLGRCVVGDMLHVVTYPDCVCWCCKVCDDSFADVCRHSQPYAIMGA